jgi:streptogramin lyase
MCAFALAPQDASAAAGTVNEFTVPTLDSFPLGITRGPDGNLWFTEQNKAKIGQITTAGAVTGEFTITTPGAVPTSIAPGADGKLWFTEDSSNKIGRVTTAGAIEDFAITTPSSAPQFIAPGGDGNLWFTEGANPGKVTQVTTAATPAFAEYPTPTTMSSPIGITPGPDGKLWFTEAGSNKIGRITTQGAFTTSDEFVIPTAAALPLGITSGPDGNLWFTEQNKSQIGRVTPTGDMDEFPVPTPSSGPSAIAPGPDGNLWFTERFANKIGRITPTGDVTEFPIPTAGADPLGITTGPDGNLWFTEFSTNKVARMTTGLDPPQFVNPAAITIPTFGAATPYPSEIQVSGLRSPILSVRVRLLGLSHSNVEDVDVLLVGPHGQKALVMADAGGGLPSPVHAQVNIADSAGFPLPDGAPLHPGLFKPANYSGADFFDPPAPGPPYAGDLSSFNGTDPNGTWQLYVMDDLGAVDSGELAGGWGLDIQTPAPPGGGSQSARDLRAAIIASASVFPRRWRRGLLLPRFTRKRAPVGTTISWRLDEAARTTLTFQRATRGRRVGRRCLKPTRARRKRRRCTRFVSAGQLRRDNAHVGLNRLRFQGRLTRKRRLRLGKYRVVVGAVDLAGNRSRSRTTPTFRIVAR